MRKAFLAFLVIALLAGTAGDLHARDCTVISKKEMRAAGVSRLSEIFRLSDDWDYFTLDGFSYIAGPFTSFDIEKQRWRTFIDGIEYDIDVFDLADINRLPVNTGDLDSVRLCSSPALVDGELIAGGCVEFFTATPQGGPGLSAAFDDGSEIGDPGPYRYTDHATANVDKFGRMVEGKAGYGDGDYSFLMQVRENIQYPTDRALYRRIRALTGTEYPRQRLHSLSTGFAFRQGAFAARVFGGLSRFRQFLFFRPLGREIPSTTDLSLVGWKGTYEPDEEFHLGGQFSISGNDLGVWHNDPGYDPAWKQTHYSGKLRFEYGGNQLRAGFAVSMAYTKAEAVRPLEDNSVFSRGFSGFCNLAVSQKTKLTTALTVMRTEHKYAVAIFLSSISRFGTDRSLSLNLIARQAPFIDPRNVWHWVREGYNLIHPDSISCAVLGVPREAQTYGLDIRWNQRAFGRMSAEFSMFLYGYFNHYIEEHEITFNAADYSVSDFVTVYSLNEGMASGQDGYIIGGMAAVDIPVNGNLDCRLFYRYRRFMRADYLFEAVYRRSPERAAGAKIYFRPDRDFTIYAQARYFGSAEWTDYREVELESDGFYKYIVPDKLIVDFGIQKFFWERKINLSLLIQNLFNDDVRYHPIGAGSDLSYNIILRISPTGL